MRRQRLTLHRFQARGKIGVVELAQHGAADRGAEGRQAVADFEPA
ncbi:hypothetical protein ACVWW7_004168 [Bradyrhizobium sp. LM6.9]